MPEDCSSIFVYISSEGGALFHVQLNAIPYSIAYLINSDYLPHFDYLKTKHHS